MKKKFKGVSFDKTRNNYKVRVHTNGTVYHIGRFKNATQGALAYNKAARKLIGKTATLNII